MNFYFFDLNLQTFLLSRMAFRSKLKIVEPRTDYAPEQIDTFYKIMKYMFGIHMESLMPIFSRVADKTQKLKMIIARANCCNVTKYELADLGIETYKLVYGCKLLESITFKNPFGNKQKITKTSDYRIFIGHERNINKILNPDFNIANKLKKIGFLSLVSSHANPDSSPEFLIRNNVFTACYCFLDFHEIPNDYDIFIRTILNSPMEVYFKIDMIGPTYIQKMEIIKKAEEEAASIIAKAHDTTKKRYESSITEIETLVTKKKELETEIAQLEYVMKKLKLEVAVARQITSTVPSIKPPPGSDYIPQLVEHKDKPISHMELPVHPQLPIRSSRFLPFINVERMKTTAALLPPEDQEKYKSSIGLNINAAQFTIGKFA